MGLMGSLGHYLMIQAYQHAPASALTPLLYVQMAFATLAGWLVFHRVPDAWSALGMATIVTSAALGARVR
jgi:drug/metabolite transporter (DMT)-like permease